VAIDRTKRELAVILHADVAGYSKLMERDEDLMIFPHDTGHRVKDHIMIRNEVIDEEATRPDQGDQNG
jgi:hypothetical protein